jgi:hypothetical protein
MFVYSEPHKPRTRKAFCCTVSGRGTIWRKESLNREFMALFSFDIFAIPTRSYLQQTHAYTQNLPFCAWGNKKRGAVVKGKLEIGKFAFDFFQLFGISDWLHPPGDYEIENIFENSMVSRNGDTT